ncbi:MAG: 50S ribosomal protein L32 [Pseudomonadota bacterium]
MAVQQNRVTRSKRNMRRSHDALKAVASNECPNCGELKLPHHVCGSCGYYRDREVVVQADEIDLEDDAA